MNRYLFVPLLLLAFSQQAAAYVDPGTGSLILQAIAAGIAVIGFTVKTYWYKILAFFGKQSKKSLLDVEESEIPGKES